MTYQLVILKLVRANPIRVRQLVSSLARCVKARRIQAALPPSVLLPPELHRVLHGYRLDLKTSPVPIYLNQAGIPYLKGESGVFLHLGRHVDPDPGVFATRAPFRERSIFKDGHK